MKRREFIRLAGGAAAPWRLYVRAPQLPKMLCPALLATLILLATPLACEAQQAKKIPRLCFLSFGPDTLQSQSPRFDAFFGGLRDLNYVNGQTIAIDYLSADGRGERYPELAAECVRRVGCGTKLAAPLLPIGADILKNMRAAPLGRSP